VFAGSHGDFEALCGNRFPPFEAVDLREAESFYQVFNATGHYDFWRPTGELAGGADYFSQGSEVEMVHVGVGQEDKIDGRKVVYLYSGMALAAQENQPLREDWVNEELASVDLQQEGGVADEGYAEFVALDQTNRAWGSGDGLLMALADEPHELFQFSYGERSVSPRSTHSSHQ
jgi:hypothetical protein